MRQVTDPGQPQDTGQIASSSPEAARFAFDKDLEGRKLDLEERKLKQARVDTWTRLVGTIVAGIIVTGAIQWYGISSDEAARKRAQSAEQAQIAIQLTNAREKALSDLRAQMFNALLQNYFKQANDRERIAILELIALNFRDAVRIRPMLELLDTQLRKIRDPREQHKLRNDLRRAARSVIRDQLEQIRQAKDGGVSRLKLAVGQSASPECFPLLAIKLLKAADDSAILVQTNSKDGNLLAKSELADSFEVSYFDTPMVDYTTVRSASLNVWRFSIVLHEVAPDRKSAEIGVACLPVSPVGAERRYGFDELLERYLHSSPSAEP